MKKPARPNPQGTDTAACEWNGIWPQTLAQPAILPCSTAEIEALGWNWGPEAGSLDILLLNGDALVDHPSFAPALLARWLIAHGFRTAVLPQPVWEDGAIEALRALPRPRLFAGASAGAIDSMLAHYTAFRKKRHDDAYTPGGKAGARPNRALIVYCGLLRRAWPGLPLVIGGLEASLRRSAHYDFWSDSLRRSILQDSKADILVYGMGEYALLQVAEKARELAELPEHARNQASGPVKDKDAFRRALSRACMGLPGTGVMAGQDELREFAEKLALANSSSKAGPKAGPEAGPEEKPAAKPEARQQLLRLPGYAEILQDRFNLMRATQMQELALHQGRDYLWQEQSEQATEAGHAKETEHAAKAGQGTEVGQATEAGQNTGAGHADAIRLAPAGRAILLAPPQQPMRQADMDRLYALPFSRLPHPAYTEAIPAWEMIRTSITTHRGCGGGCSFCSLALHQGRGLASRSRESILAEARRISEQPDPLQNTPGPQAPGQTLGKASGQANGQANGKAAGKPPRWAGAISDVGGPSANMWQGECTLDKSRCKRPSCLFPKPCPGFAVDQKKAVSLLREIAALPGVRHVRVASGVRFDMAVNDPEALKAYSTEFTGGQLKIAPEHIAEPVLRLMRKPGLPVFEAFLAAFARHCREQGLEQYVVPYIISAFPGCRDEDMRALADWFKSRGWKLQQVQCFIPTPGTIATAMYYCEQDPEGHPIYVAKSDAERLAQHHRLFAWEKEQPRQKNYPEERPEGHRANQRANQRTNQPKHQAENRRGNPRSGPKEQEEQREQRGNRPAGSPYTPPQKQHAGAPANRPAKDASSPRKAQEGRNAGKAAPQSGNRPPRRGK